MIHKVNESEDMNSAAYYSWCRSMRQIVLISGFLVLAGCASTPATAPRPAEVSADAPVAVENGEDGTPEPRPSPEDYPVRAFEGDALYDLLVAEVAGYRSDYDLALEKYLAATAETLDPGVAARATRLALYMKNDPAALQAVAVWTEQDPEDIDAHRHAADLLLRAGRFDEAIEHMEQIKNLGGLAKFDVFAYRAANMQPAQRRSLLQAMDEMLSRHPGDEQLLFSRAVLLEQEGLLEQALSVANELIERSDNVNVAVLKMSLLTSLQRHREARAFLEQEVAKTPDNRRLRLILARLLFEMGDLDAAKQQYMVVLANAPNDGDVLFALALIALELKDDATAEKHFQRMVRWDRRSGEAHYYLGGIAERSGDPQRAIREYTNVRDDGYEFIPAHARIAALLVDDGRIEEARHHLELMRQQVPARRQQLIMVESQLMADRGMSEEVLAFLDEQIQAEPENIELLYFRAMTGQRFDRLDILEADLRAIIAMDPDNADALNALGYTLTDQTDRHEEALALIERALSLKPDEAAFIDSMGWVQYRLNNLEEAVVYLRRALALFQNDEVAAHLGEVLWVMGEKMEALQIWEEALRFAPDSEFLKHVIERFKGE